MALPYTYLMLESAERRKVRLTIREIIFEEFQPVSSQSTNVTDRQTDGRTTYHDNVTISINGSNEK